MVALVWDQRRGSIPRQGTRLHTRCRPNEREKPMSNFQAYINDYVKPKTKKALREAVATDPESVTFEDTSAFNSRGTITVSELRPSDVIVGPDAYTTRNWYANVKNGKVV